MLHFYLLILSSDNQVSTVVSIFVDSVSKLELPGLFDFRLFYSIALRYDTWMFPFS